MRTEYLQNFESIYNKTLRYEHHNENFKERVLRDVTPFGLRIKMNPGINVVSPDFMKRWNLALKISERRLVKLFRKEKEKVVTSLDTVFENFLNEVFSENILVTRVHVIKNGKHIAESLQQRRDYKWQEFERQMNFDGLKCFRSKETEE